MILSQDKSLLFERVCSIAYRASVLEANFSFIVGTQAPLIIAAVLTEVSGEVSKVLSGYKNNEKVLKVM